MCKFITSGEFDAMMSSHQSFVLLDVRGEAECASGNIPGSICLPHWLIPFRIHELAPEKNTPIVVYCLNGHRSWIAAMTLESYGYTNVISLDGGFEQYCKEHGG